ncbi:MULTISPECIES: type IV secretion system protein VirB8 [Rhizobium]|uniref:type IV secretion system protein VirB8 n=1 Tax=Rhizobium TaxID=379 RepID=UPI001C8299EC|nr:MULTISPECIES: type IV secretion system protein VirB8 [Rhizobium]MBX4899643.1 type IV secretion system protein VirB8 [Rhizobium bangladeshense]MBX5297561.1 type IV secretion system protein VirB8 [Rhizobium sp. NLR15a]MBY3617821.1 type IV secretion system protein VirB8 [Rhizobium bangladeshense]
MKGPEYALLVQKEALAEHYKEVESFQTKRAKSAYRLSRLALVVAVVATLGNVAQGFAIAVMVPMEKLVPVFLWVREDGTIDSEISISSLPATQEQAVINSVLWQYVRLREGYTFDTAQYAYDLVSNLSNANVRQEYQQYFNYPNPGSPQVTLGKRGRLQVEHISSNEIAAGVQQIRYKRTLVIEGQTPVSSTWTATIRYEKEAILPAHQRLDNPAGLIISAYQTSEDTISSLGQGK